MTRFNSKKGPSKLTSQVALALGGMLALSGCVAEDEDPMVHLDEPDALVFEQAIQNGTVDSTTKSVVGMYTFQGQFGGICSGILIAPNLVLTAQHCIASLNSQYVDCNTSMFGGTYPAQNIYVTTDTTLSQNGRFYGAREVIVPPNGSGVCGNDIALIILSQRVQNSVTTPITPRLDEPVSRYERYRAVGYGHTGNGAGSGTRRSISDRVIQCGGSSLCPSWAATREEFVSYDSNTCQGDSGGAALDTQGRLIGTLSRGGADPNNRNNQCFSSVHTSVASWAPWIRATAIRAAQLGGYNAPAWANGSTVLDTDYDGLDDDNDNCVNVANPNQNDLDNDGYGDVCDNDLDGDGQTNDRDNCVNKANADQVDYDNDGYGDICDNDDDNDGQLDTLDNCPLIPNSNQADSDGDGLGDVCDSSTAPSNNSSTGNSSTGNNSSSGNNSSTGNSSTGNNTSTGNSSTGNNSSSGNNTSTGNNTGGPSTGNSSSGDNGDDDEIIIIIPEPEEEPPVDGTCSSTGQNPVNSPFSLVGLAGMMLIGLRRRR